LNTNPHFTKVSFVSRRVGRTKNIAHMGEMKNAQKKLFGKLKRGDYLIELNVDGRMILTLRLLMSYIYIYGAPILDVSRSHTTTHHSR